MRKLFVLLALAFSIPAFATNYTVKAGGGGSFTTIQACATAMAAGDTCTVFAGTYAEDVTVTSGTVGNYKTFNVNGTDTVIVHSFTIGSHVKIIGNCVPGSTQGTCGFSIQNTASPTNAPCVTVNSGGQTDYYLVSNNLYACGVYMIKEDFTSNTTFGFIQGNTLSYSCSTSSAPNVCSSMAIEGDHHLIENNDISHVSDGPYIFGQHNVYRKNNLHNITDADCGSNSGNCHVDFVQQDANVTGGGVPAAYTLFENNTTSNMVVTGAFAGAAMHAGPLLQAEACNGLCQNAIIRFNTASHISGGGTTNDNGGATPPPQAWINVKSYNNDWIDMLVGFTSAGFGINGHDYGSTGWANLNEIYQIPFTSANQTNPYYCISAHSSCTPSNYGNNLAFCPGGTSCASQLFGHIYNSGAFTADPGNVYGDPLFVNYAGNNFSLSAGSPALATGTNLTTISSSDTGTGTSLIVNDAGYFQDGSGIPGVLGDCIAVRVVTNRVCVTAVNYSTNTLTLAGGILRSSGDPVWLYSDSSGRPVLTGAAPNMGSFVSGATWFVRPGGGTRASVNLPTAQCDGLADVDYPGSGSNQHCAFNDVRYLWVDNSQAPMGWVMSGGDLAVVRGCTALPSQANPSNPNCRLGYDSETSGNPPNNWCGYGVANTNCFPSGVPNGVVLGNITAVSVSGGIATITANNMLTAGSVVMFNGLSGGPSVGPAWLAGQDMNGRPYIVTSTGLSTTQFEVLATEPNGSWSDTGQFARPTIIEGGCAYDSTPGPCFTGNSTNTANLPQIYSGMGLSAAFNIQGSQFFAFNGINLTTHNKVDSGTPFTPSGTYTAGQIIFDGTNIQAVTIGGVAGAAPSWNGTVGGLTTTGAVTFKNEGPNCVRIGNPAYPVRCATGTPYDDWGDDGFLTFSNTGPGSFTDVWVHGMSASGFHGPIGGALTFTRVNSSFNAMAGYNFDLGPGGPNSTGFPNNPASSIAMSYVTMDWNGCNAEYPAIDSIPCLIAYTISNGGFGDGLSGQDSNLASATCDHCEFANNFKDAWLGPHTATGSVKITNSVAMNNAGQTWKGNLGATGKFLMQNNVTNANCRRSVQPVTGAPSTFNAGIASADMCRFDGSAIAIVWPGNGGSFELDNNTFITATGNVSYDYSCWTMATGISSIVTGGSGYAVNDTIYLGGGGTIVTVTSIGAGGSVTGLSLTTAGMVVNPFETYSWTAGAGSGLTMNLSTTNANCGLGTRVMRNNSFIGYTNTSNPTWNGSTLNFICYSSCQGNPGNSNDTQWTTRSNNNMYGFQNGNDGACTYPGETCVTPLMNVQPVQTWTSETQLDPYNPKLAVASNSFYPSATSPLIGAGVTISGITTDYFGATRPSPPTIGAVEPSSSGPVTAPTDLKGITLKGLVIH